jgi:homoserine O-acetyltransferase
MQRVKGGRIFLIPGSAQTAGHGTTGAARHWKAELAKVLASAPRLLP